MSGPDRRYESDFVGSAGVAYPISIYVRFGQHAPDEGLQIALDTLRSEAIPIDGAAQLTSGDQHVLTILIRTEEGRTKAIYVLTRAGF